MVAVVKAVCLAGARDGCSVGMFLARVKEQGRAARGARKFLPVSDYAFLDGGVAALRNATRA